MFDRISRYEDEAKDVEDIFVEIQGARIAVGIASEACKSWLEITKG